MALKDHEFICPTCKKVAIDHDLYAECDCGYYYDAMANKVTNVGQKPNGEPGVDTPPPRYVAGE